MAVPAQSQLKVTEPLVTLSLRFITATSLFGVHYAAASIIHHLFQNHEIRATHFGYD